MNNIFDSFVNLYTVTWDLVSDHPWIAVIALIIGTAAGWGFAKQLGKLDR